MDIISVYNEERFVERDLQPKQHNQWHYKILNSKMKSFTNVHVFCQTVSDIYADDKTAETTLN